MCGFSLSFWGEGGLVIRWFGRWKNESVLIWVYWTVLDVVAEGDGNGILGMELWEMEGDVGVGWGRRAGWDGIEECCFWLGNGR